ncbi:MAG: hypothetical protein WDN72_03665 [Alphaproteobacteria bacterium]
MDALFANDPFREFYNLEGTEIVALTTDIDWAPDYAVASLYELVAEFGFKLTAFMTHDDGVSRTAGDWLEIGLHPDHTRPDPERGFPPKLERLKELYPMAKGLRCHRNFFGNNISDIAKKLGLVYDASVLLWRQPFGQAYVDYNGIARMTYCWEDGMHADMKCPMTIDEVRLDTPGLKILNVHPILMYLNAPDDHWRRKVTGRYTDLTRAPKSEIEPHVHTGYGLRSFYRDLLMHLKERNIRTVHCLDIAKAGLKAA